jgi:hypothetical protein
MSTLSQFTGGGSPVGSLLPMWGVPTNPTIGGAEYLRTGSVKSITGYTQLLTTAPRLCFTVSTQPNNTVAHINPATAIRYAGSNYYVMGSSNGGAPYTATSLTSTWVNPTVDTDVTLSDLFTFNSYCYHFVTASLVIYRLSGAVGLSVNLTSGNTYFCGAVNTAGNLGVAVSTMDAVAGRIHTSTTGATWTSQTPSGGSATQALFAVWQPVSSTFAYMDGNGLIHTTANGYTLTNRGTPSGLTVVQSVYTGGTNTTKGAQSSFCAASSSVTLLSVRGTLSGVVNQQILIRSADGINFTATPWSSLIGFTPSATPKISEQAGVFIAILPAVTGRITDTESAWQSTDGVTWSPLPIPMNTAQGLTALINEYRYMNGSYVVLTDSSQVTPPFTVASLAATHVGVPLASTVLTSNGATLTHYVRIK